MWSRAELKDHAKESLRWNYWWLVLAGLIFSLIEGKIQLTKHFGKNSFKFNDYTNVNQWKDGYFFGGNELRNAMWSLKYKEKVFNNSTVGFETFLIFFMAFIIVFLVIFVVGFAVRAFLINPLIIGFQRFFTKSLVEKTEFRVVGSGFTENYMNGVKILFLRDLFNALWYFLLIVPGIIKLYEYRMIPYIVADNPNISRKEAFEMSREMMMGEKWNAFVLDLSFIGWNILSGITLGLVGIFYVVPYQALTNAALYLRLSGKDRGNFASQGNSNPNYYGPQDGDWSNQGTDNRYYTAGMDNSYMDMTESTQFQPAETETVSYEKPEGTTSQTDMDSTYFRGASDGISDDEKL